MASQAVVVDPGNVQGLVFGGWGRQMPYAAFVFATGATVDWLRAVLHEVTDSRLEHQHADERVQIAFTDTGLAALGVDDDARDQLPAELTRKMDSRWRVLGDREESAPQKWTLLPVGSSCDVLLLLFAKSHEHRAHLVARHRSLLEMHGGVVIAEEESARWRDKEQFGFADGLSQPDVDGVSPHTRKDNVVATGEALLGYVNQYGKLPRTPQWRGFDLGKDGTYLVFRKLEQDVVGFWQYFAAQGRALAGQKPVPADPLVAAYWLAARVLGRWPSGASLVQSPERDDPRWAAPEVVNAFAFLDQDRDGMRCPIASHVRRANPRDARGGDADDSLTVVNRHRILRRGRAFGDGYLEPEAAMRGEGAGVKRGLHFISLQASIARGFEFVQQTWNGNGNFHALQGEPDGVVGRGGGHLTIPADPIRLRLAGLPRFVTTRGGGYFFLPSIGALRRLADSR